MFRRISFINYFLLNMERDGFMKTYLQKIFNLSPSDSTQSVQEREIAAELENENRNVLKLRA